MTAAEALKIITSLADGRCPITGQVLADVYQQPDVIRALFVAMKALERVERIDRHPQMRKCQRTQTELWMKLKSNSFAMSLMRAKQFQNLLPFISGQKMLFRFD